MQSTVTDELSCISQVLADKVGPQKYRIWFKNTTKMSLADGYLKVGVPNLFIANWIENHFWEDINQAAKEITGSNVNITFSIDPELTGHQRKTQLDSQARAVNSVQNRTIQQRKMIVSPPKRRLKLNLDTFIVGKSNQLAYNAALAVAREKKSPFNPLFIHGGYGVGKTHLLQGICNAVCHNRPQTNWLYLSAEDFANQFILALKTKKLEAFRRRMRQMELLAIDDIHFLASKPSTQEEFLHTFNSINLAGKQVVMVSDAHPKMIGQLSEKLINRFVSGMVAKIESPDFEVRCQICRQYSKAMRIHIPETVITYIAQHIKTNVRELEGALLKLVAFSSLQNKKINRYMAKEILDEHLARTDPIVHISDIESAAATFFGTTPANLHSSKKNRTVALARHFSMYLARKHTKMSSTEIGRFMGNKNHATVLLACSKVEDQVRRNVQLNWQTAVGNKVSKARTVLAHLEESITS
ncbi:MAG: chromosomal replication initiator protein DnaA [Planctomycetota bacterium]|jgi:chromosomal replication initiator protein